MEVFASRSLLTCSGSVKEWWGQSCSCYKNKWTPRAATAVCLQVKIELNSTSFWVLDDKTHSVKPGWNPVDTAHTENINKCPINTRKPLLISVTAVGVDVGSQVENNSTWDFLIANTLLSPVFLRSERGIKAGSSLCTTLSCETPHRSIKSLTN